ncbi:MAG: response regulator [Treponema sp.]|jgi:two-component system response regulator YesN|nr:response regulator [Treponema sp.]
MKKVLIVDDEVIPRKSLKSIIPWAEFGYTIAGEAANGKAALTMVEELAPELIFTDITMPVMNGIEFIRALKEKGISAKVVILSCHEDFTYLRDAMRLGAVDYLLKHTFEAEDIRRLLSKIDEQFRKEYIESESIEWLRQDLWKRFLLGHLSTGEKIRYRLNGLIPEGPGLFRILLAEVSSRNTIVSFLESYRARAGDKTGLDRIWLVNEGKIPSGERVFLIFSFKAGCSEADTAAVVHDFYGGLCRMAAKQDHACNAAGSCLYRNWAEIHEAWKEAVEGMDMKADLSKYGQKVRQALTYIRNNYARQISLEDISGYIGISRIYLSQIFKKETGQNISDFLLGYRISRAKKMLMDSDLKIYEIADMSGFGSAQYFSRIFKEQTGMNPNEYRTHSRS